MQYCDLRIANYDLICTMLQDPDHSYDDSLSWYNTQINDLLVKLSNE